MFLSAEQTNTSQGFVNGLRTGTTNAKTVGTTQSDNNSLLWRSLTGTSLMKTVLEFMSLGLILSVEHQAFWL